MQTNELDKIIARPIYGNGADDGETFMLIDQYVDDPERSWKDKKAAILHIDKLMGEETPQADLDADDKWFVEHYISCR